MNRISKKFILGITLILVLSTISAIFITKNFAGNYYVSQKKDELNEVTSKFIKEVTPDNFKEISEKIEDQEKVIIVSAEKNEDNEAVNLEIREGFLNKGIGFKKLWLWEDDYKTVVEGQDKIRLYEQEKLNYSVLIRYISKNDIIYAVAMIVPNISDSFYIINTFFAFISSLTIILAIIFITFLVKRIINPLNKFNEFASEMSKGNFIPLNVKTNDELEDVSKTLNQMGQEIINYQDELEEKNKQMEDLLNNVAHDLKTPLSLVKLYSEGIKDGLDDGTFLDTITNQSSEMASMVERLLFISKIENEIIPLNEVNVSRLLSQILRDYKLLSQQDDIEIISAIQDNLIIMTNEEWLKSIFQNLISNSVKYSSGSLINVALEKNDSIITFKIANEFNNENLDLHKIWQPYYVGEKSRSKELSGTGLGLYIIKKITDKLGYQIDTELVENNICFILKISID